MRSVLRNRVWLVLVTVIVTLALVLLGVNFMSGEKKIERHIERLYALDDPRFGEELGVLLGPPFLPDNRVKALQNGDQIFPAMLAAIRGAQTSITFETYIYWSGEIGAEFAAALGERARNGVKVHVLLDWVGSAKAEQSLLDQMIAAGVQLHRFHPPHWSNLGRMNNRTHRKLLIADGRIAFTGPSTSKWLSRQCCGSCALPVHSGAMPTPPVKAMRPSATSSLRCVRLFMRPRFDQCGG